MIKDQIQKAVLRTLSFHAAWNYAPSKIQLFQTLDFGSDVVEIEQSRAYLEFESILQNLTDGQAIICGQGRFALTRNADTINLGREKEIFFPRKLAHARKAAAYLTRLPNVRCVCICNTVALGQSKDDSDIDFFIITRAGSIWRTRLLAVAPFKLLNARPGESRKKDPVCLSFFITDQALDLSPFKIDDADDPYLRYWFLTLLPLSDDGILRCFWSANADLISRHPFAQMPMALDKGPIIGGRECIDDYQKNKTAKSFLENWVKNIQLRNFPPGIVNTANKSTQVVINDNVLKFHVTDARAQIRERYHQICHEYNVTP
ncbi:MAG: hypothetical protein ACOYUZ_05185 [Patescibacteria group bacterium]